MIFFYTGQKVQEVSPSNDTLFGPSMRFIVLIEIIEVTDVININTKVQVSTKTYKNESQNLYE